QDIAVQAGQGPIADRSNERLGRSDLAIIVWRKILERELRAMRRPAAEGMDTRPGRRRADLGLLGAVRRNSNPLPGVVPGIHVFLRRMVEAVSGREWPERVRPRGNITYKAPSPAVQERASPHMLR